MMLGAQVRPSFADREKCGIQPLGRYERVTLRVEAGRPYRDVELT